MKTDFNDPLGVDFACIDDLDASLTLVSGNIGLGHSAARRHITPRGGLFYDRDYGNDVRRFLKSSGFSPAQGARIVESETLKDERVRATAAEVDFDLDNGDLLIKERITPIEGQSFDLTLSIDELTVRLLNEDVTI